MLVRVAPLRQHVDQFARAGGRRLRKGLQQGHGHLALMVEGLVEQSDRRLAVQALAVECRRRVCDYGGQFIHVVTLSTAPSFGK